MNTTVLLDIHQTAERLGTTERQIRSLIYRRELPFVKVGAKVRFCPDDIERYIETRRVDSAR